VQSDTMTYSSSFLTSAIADCTATWTDAFMEAFMEIILTKNDMDECDKGEEMSLME
jgi:hypothetical protein